LPAEWELFDAYTGDALFNVTSIPSGTTVAGPSGEQLKYVFANAGTAAKPNWYLAQWNSSKLWQYDINPYDGEGSLSPAIINATNGILLGGGTPSQSGTGVFPIGITGTVGTLPNGVSAFAPYGSTISVNGNVPINGISGLQNSIEFPSLTTYDWNVSVPWLNTMPPPPATVNATTGQLIPPAPGTNPASVIAANPGDLMLCRNGSLPVGYPAADLAYPQLPYTYFAVNLNASKGAIGSILWMQNFNPPAGNLTVIQGPVDWQTRVFVQTYVETTQWVGFSLSTGQQIWGPTASQAAFDYYGTPGNVGLGSGSVMAYGKLYSSAFSGICYCYNDLTGKLEWTYGNGGSGNSTYAGFNTSYGDYPTFIQSIADGVVYLATDEHTIIDPIYKGATSTGINATTGQQIWQLSDYPSEWSTSGSAWVVADGYATFMNGYDNNIYCVGQGPSSTTVQAPQIAITAGTNVVIQGTVMDISAGTTQAEQAADFPHGVPCASDAIMSQWMGYVYQQQPKPTNFVGVTVTLTAIDPNGNYITIGTTNTTNTGLYTLSWTPPNVAGNYLVTATFAGTNSYWGSNAQTGMTVQGPSATAAPTAAPVSGLATASDLTYGIVAAVIAIIIVGALLFLALRKRP